MQNLQAFFIYINLVTFMRKTDRHKLRPRSICIYMLSLELFCTTSWQYLTTFPQQSVQKILWKGCRSTLLSRGGKLNTHQTELSASNIQTSYRLWGQPTLSRRTQKQDMLSTKSILLGLGFKWTAVVCSCQQPRRIPMKWLKSWCWTPNCFSQESATLNIEFSLSWSPPFFLLTHTSPCIL